MGGATRRASGMVPREHETGMQNPPTTTEHPRAERACRLANRPRASGPPARLASLLVAAALALLAPSAHAVDPFEIQVYDGTANAPGVPGLELHVNSVPIGVTTAPSPQYPENGQTHFTLEPSLGLFPWWELGGYFLMALRGDQAFDYAGVKLRNKFVTPPGWDPRWRLGMNVEFSLLPVTYDRGRWANELRPIVAWENERFAFALDPIVDTSLAGPDASAGPTFEPCFSAAVKLHDVVSVGVEYYTNFGPFSGFLPWSQEEQYVYEVVNLLGVKRLELNAGVGEGLTNASNRLVLKAILGYTWEDEPPARPPIPTHDGATVAPPPCGPGRDVGAAPPAPSVG